MMLFRFALPLAILLLSTQMTSAVTNSVVTTPNATTSSPPTSTAPPTVTAPVKLSTPTANTPVNAVIALQQKHKLELAQQQSRLELLEQANQTALTNNQELQLKNDNLTVQVQVLQSERSAQMFLYGAATFGGGIFIGLIIYNIISSRRRRQW